MPVAGDIGTQVEITVKSNGAVVDLSSATTLELIVFRTGGSVVTKTGTLTSDGTDGRFDATLESGDLSVAGNYIMQARIVTPAGEWRSALKDLLVRRKLG